MSTTLATASVGALMISGAVAGFTAGLAGGLLNGASLGDSLKMGLKGAIFGAISAGIASGIGTLGETMASSWGSVTAAKAGKAILHGLTRAAISKAQGGRWSAGFWSGFAGSALGGLSNYAKSFGGKMAISAIVGGTASRLGGGKFANGAVSAAFVHMYNAMGHSGQSKNQIKKYTLGIHSNVTSQADFTAGHSWISLTNNDTGEIHTYGLWADEAGFASNGSGSVMLDMELIRGYSFESNQFTQITQAQYDSIGSMLVAGSDTWYITHTCADYARDTYGAATGINLDADDYFGIETPRELARNIGN